MKDYKRIKQMTSVFGLSLILTSCRTNEVVQTTVDDGSSIITIEEDSSQAKTTKDDVDNSSGRTFVSDSFNCSFYTEDYALHYSNHGRLQIFDVKTKEDHVYCFDPGCEHKRGKRSITGEVLEAGCIAYELSSSTIMPQDDNCYFMKDTGEVIRSDLQGMNQRAIGSLPPYLNYNNAHDIFYSKDSLFVIFDLPYEMIEVKDENGESSWIVGGMKDKETRGIIQIDLNNGTRSEVFSAEDYNSYLSQTDVRGDHMYFAYWYCDIPYMDMFGETYGRTIPEELKGLSPEEYREELNKRRWVDVYDYNISTGELTASLKHKHVEEGNIVFCKGFFALSEDENTSGLYRYDGERFRQLDFGIQALVRSDDHLVCCSNRAPGDYMQIDEKTGEVLKRIKTPVSYDAFLPRVIIGESCYGILNKNGVMAAGYVPASDFWNGDITNAVQFMQEE